MLLRTNSSLRCDCGRVANHSCLVSISEWTYLGRGIRVSCSSNYLYFVTALTRAEQPTVLSISLTLIRWDLGEFCEHNRTPDTSALHQNSISSSHPACSAMASNGASCMSKSLSERAFLP